MAGLWSLSGGVGVGPRGLSAVGSGFAGCLGKGTRRPLGSQAQWTWIWAGDSGMSLPTGWDVRPGGSVTPTSRRLHCAGPLHAYFCSLSSYKRK